MYKQLYRWQLQLDRKTLRERAIIFAVLIFVIYIIWDLLLFSSANQQVTSVQDQITVVQREISEFQKNEQHITQAAADPANQKLIQRYHELQQEIANITNKIRTYRYNTVSYAQMSGMLQSVLKDVPGIKIESFKTIEMAAPIAKEPAGIQAASKNTDKHAGNNIKKTDIEPFKPHSNYYELVVTGDFFGLQAFVAHLERLDWKIYWDSFVYQVTKRPKARLVLNFHTLSIEVVDGK